MVWSYSKLFSIGCSGFIWERNGLVYICTIAVNSFWPLCMYELQGKCNNDECPFNMLRIFLRDICIRMQMMVLTVLIVSLVWNHVHKAWWSYRSAKSFSPFVAISTTVRYMQGWHYVAAITSLSMVFLNVSFGVRNSCYEFSKFYRFCRIIIISCIINHLITKLRSHKLHINTNP